MPPRYGAMASQLFGFDSRRLHSIYAHSSEEWGLARPGALPRGLARLHGYLVMLEAFIFLHLPLAFLHCFFVPASEISDPSALMQWRLAFANAAGEAARANAAIRANFIQLLLGWICLLAILARPRGLASIELARTGGGAWPVAERL